MAQPVIPRRIAVVVGVRPNFVKAAPLCSALRQHPAIEHALIHSGQHYDEEMSGRFFRDLCLEEPTVNLGIGPGSHCDHLAKILLRLGSVLDDFQPDTVVVIGDVDSTLGAALCGAAAGYQVAHVEAGLRSNDHGPEERNRRLITRLASLHFAPCQWSTNNLIAEGVPEASVHLVGSLMACTLLRTRPRWERIDVSEKFAVQPGSYIVVTAHKELTLEHNSERIRWLTERVLDLADRGDVLWPLHPRTRARLSAMGLMRPVERLRFLPPLSYLEMCAITSKARCVVTDSDGLQEETTTLGVPCYTITEKTARTATTALGTNNLIDPRDETITDIILQGKCGGAGRLPPRWDTAVGDRIVRILAGLPAGLTENKRWPAEEWPVPGGGGLLSGARRRTSRAEDHVAKGVYKAFTS